jgi:hypothetical protein
LALATVDAAATAATEIAYEVQPTSGQTQKRLIGQHRILYRKDDLSAFLPVGNLESKALAGQSYKLAFTPGVLHIFQPNATTADLTTLLTGAEAQYTNLDGDGRLWVPSGQVFYSPTPGDSAPAELAFAQAHFFLPHRYQDPFSNNTVVTFDGHDLLLISTVDAVLNEISADNDYRVLQPKLITDPNGNRIAASFDALGLLAGTTVCGKASGPVEGDSFDTFTVDLSPADITAFFDSTNPSPLALTHLGTATTRILYDLGRVPVCAASIARETHVSDLIQGAQTEVQIRFVYSDGFGREAQTKVQAEPGPLDLGDPNSPLANPRWVGTGEKVYNIRASRSANLSRFSARRRNSVSRNGVWAILCSTIQSGGSLQRSIQTIRSKRSFSIRGSGPPMTLTIPSPSIRRPIRMWARTSASFPTLNICRRGISSGSLEPRVPTSWTRR